MFAVDFKRDPEVSRLIINEWVERQTNEHIKNLVPKGEISGLTKLVLTNAIYFKGEWLEPFKEANTESRNFTLVDGSTLKTLIMNAYSLEVARYAAFNADGTFFPTPRTITINSRSTERRGQVPSNKYPDEDGFAIAELPYKGGALSMVIIAPLKADSLKALERNLSTEKTTNWIGQLKEREIHLDRKSVV